MKKFILCIALFLITGCSQVVPFEDTRREAGQVQPVGRSTNEQPVICYNPIWHSVDDTKELAQAACTRTQRKPIYVKSEAMACRLFNPSIAIYKCE